MPVTIEAWHITGQSQIDSYVGRWAELAVLLVNELHVTRARGRPVTPPANRRAALDEALHGHGWTPGRPLTDADAERLAGVAAELHPAFAGDVTALNQVLLRHGAVPTLYGDPPRLAFHRAGASLPDAWAADAATALAMVIGVGQGARLRSCEAEGCELVFFDVTKNTSRRFCGLSCQNRAKASAYRARRRA
ncbi:CGNR zinc finger protein [Nonomuraea fuscirosea]|uniref:CGNR zinc finger protein n=1 Tax=Nonomuraea fuscirosea TaxID=1291556 RepID=A0A2T0N1Z2_9ACTN|nr:CGNR zinc finger protein [Nonomuraea fuscirosea]